MHSKMADAIFSCLEQARNVPCSRVGEFAYAKFSSRHSYRRYFSSCLEQARNVPCSRVGEFAYAKFSSRHSYRPILFPFDI